MSGLTPERSPICWTALARRNTGVVYLLLEVLGMTARVFVAAGLLCSAVNAAAMSGPCPGKTARVVWLRDVVAHIPLVAEPHADDFKLTFGALSQYQYARSTGARFGADFDVGAEPALVGCGSSGIVLQPRPPKVPGEYRIALYVPVSFHMLWDLADPSVPIINNDYRFSAAMIKGIA